MHLIPRTYDKEIPDGQTQPFRLTSNYGYEFRDDPNKVKLSKYGQDLISKNVEDFNVSLS
jgi:hypothetical protein